MRRVAITESLKILLADDHAVVREGIRRVLMTQPDITVMAEVGDGKSLFELAVRLHPDLVITDMIMPGMDAIEAIKSIKEELPLVRILVLSAYGDDDLIKAALEAGADAYLVKAVSGDSLITTLRAVCRGQKLVLSQVSPLTMQAHQQPIFVSYGLTFRQRQVLELVVEGKRNKVIAKEIGISQRTVEAHLNHIFSKLGVSTRTEAAVRALEQGFLHGVA